MIPRNMKSRDMVGMEVRTAREIMNGAGIVVPKGTKVKIEGFGRAFAIETERCPYCSLSAYITGVTRDEVELIPENYKKMTNADRIRTMTNEELADFQQYRAIGTIEECREARERQKPKKPKIINEGISTCPICGAKVLRCYDFCKDCGQAIDWSK